MRISKASLDPVMRIKKRSLQWDVQPMRLLCKSLNRREIRRRNDMSEPITNAMRTESGTLQSQCDLLRSLHVQGRPTRVSLAGFLYRGAMAWLQSSLASLAREAEAARSPVHPAASTD